MIMKKICIVTVKTTIKIFTDLHLKKKLEEDSFEKDCYMYMNIVSVQGKIY